jgi:hypothetical protein
MAAGRGRGGAGPPGEGAARHGRRLDSAAAVGSELDWLTALRADTGLSVPEPVRTTTGKLTTAAASPDVPEPRVCPLLRWMDGRVHSSVPRQVHLRRLGSVMARLHNHASQWCPPAGFARIRWDWETFFGDTMVYEGINAADAWDLIPADLRRKFDRVASGMQRVMTQLGDGADQVGLIHADLHLDNALFWRDDVRIIDFDDCGFGYWLYDIAVPLWELRHRRLDARPLFNTNPPRLALPQSLVSLLDSGRSHQWSTLWPQRDSKAQSRRPGCKYIPRPRWSMRLPRSAGPAGPKAGNPQTPSLMLARGAVS